VCAPKITGRISLEIPGNHRSTQTLCYAMLTGRFTVCIKPLIYHHLTSHQQCEKKETFSSDWHHYRNQCLNSNRTICQETTSQSLNSMIHMGLFSWQTTNFLRDFIYSMGKMRTCGSYNRLKCIC